MLSMTMKSLPDLDLIDEAADVFVVALAASSRSAAARVTILSPAWDRCCGATARDCAARQAASAAGTWPVAPARGSTEAPLYRTPSTPVSVRSRPSVIPRASASSRSAACSCCAAASARGLQCFAPARGADRRRRRTAPRSARGPRAPESPAGACRRRCA